MKNNQSFKKVAFNTHVLLTNETKELVLNLGPLKLDDIAT